MSVFQSVIEFINNHQVLLMGVCLPLVIFFIQLWLWRRDHKTCSITFIENRNYILDPSLSNRVSGLSILYEGEPVKDWLLYYQVTITNSGVKDISSAEVSNPLTITLPSNVQVRSCKVFDKSEFLDIVTKVKDNEIIIEWDLFKREEHLRLDIIADYHPKGEYKYDKHSLLSKITYNKSRIQDLQVQKTNIRSYEIFLRNLKTMVFFLLAMFFFYALVNRTEVVKEFSFTSNNIEQVAPLSFEKDSVYVTGDCAINYPVIISGVHDKEVERKDPLIKGYIFFLVDVWGFILLEQIRMRRKRVRYGLVSDKPWNQFDIEDC